MCFIQSGHVPRTPLRRSKLAPENRAWKKECDSYGGKDFNIPAQGTAGESTPYVPWSRLAFTQGTSGENAVDISHLFICLFWGERRGKKDLPCFHLDPLSCLFFTHCFRMENFKVSAGHCSIFCGWSLEEHVGVHGWMFLLWFHRPLAYCYSLTKLTYQMLLP